MLFFKSKNAIVSYNGSERPETEFTDSVQINVHFDLEDFADSTESTEPTNTYWFFQIFQIQPILPNQ